MLFEITEVTVTLQWCQLNIYTATQTAICNNSNLEAEKINNSVITTAQKLGRANTTIWTYLKRQKSLMYNRQRIGQSRKTTAVDDRNIVRAEKKNPKTTSPTTSRKQGWKYHSLSLAEDFESRITEARIRRPDWNLQSSTEMSQKSSGTKFYGQMRPRWPLPKWWKAQRVEKGRICTWSKAH